MSKLDTTKLTVKDTLEQIALKRAELATLRRNVALQRDTKNHQIKVMRRDIARLITATNQQSEEK